MEFLFRYIGLHPFGHAVVLIAVLLAVACSVSTQFGMKHLIDIVSMGQQTGAPLVWGAFALLCGLVAADNLLWRVAGYTAHLTFVAVTGDIRRDLFAYLSGHAPGFFASRLPGGLASRVSSSANNTFIVMNTTVWNVIPPIVAVAPVDRLHRLGQPATGAGPAGAGLAAGRRHFHPGAPRHAAASGLRRGGRRRWMANWST